MISLNGFYLVSHIAHVSFLLSQLGRILCVSRFLIHYLQMCLVPYIEHLLPMCWTMIRLHGSKQNLRVYISKCALFKADQRSMLEGLGFCLCPRQFAITVYTISWDTAIVSQSCVGHNVYDIHHMQLRSRFCISVIFDAGLLTEWFL